MAAEFVYVVAWRPRGPTKIGVASSVVSRLHQLQTGNPNRLKVWAAWRVDQYALGIESEILRRYEPLRLVGEWLNLPPRQVIQAVKGFTRDNRMTLVRWQPTAQEQEARERQYERVQNRRTQDAIEMYKWLMKQ